MADDFGYDDMRAFANLLRHEIREETRRIQKGISWSTSDLAKIVTLGDAVHAIEDAADKLEQHDR